MSKEKRPDRMRRHPARAARGTTGDHRVLVPLEERSHHNLVRAGSTARLLQDAPHGTLRGTYMAALLIVGSISWQELTEPQREQVRAAYRRRSRHDG